MSAYDLRLYTVAEGELATLERVLRELAMPMMPEHGIEPIGFWSDPQASKFYQISRHRSFDAIETNWDRFHADPRWALGLREHRQDRVIVKGVETTFLAGIVGMPPLHQASAN